MQQKVKYPITEKARDMARALVQAWRDGLVRQSFSLIESGFETGGGEPAIYKQSGIDKVWDFPESPIASLLELSHFQLVVISRVPTDSGGAFWEVLLMQELINAVENDFAVSDFFLTTQAIGTIVTAGGNLTINSPVWGAASIYGDVAQNYQQLTQSLENALGDEFLETHKELKEAIEQLASATQENHQSKLGKVLSELGRSFEHGANAVTLLPAIVNVAAFISKVLTA